MIKFNNKLCDTEEIEKLFSNLKDDRERVRKGIGKVLNELTKILVLHNTCNSDLKHWLDELVGFMMEAVSVNLSPVLMFSPLFESGSFPKGFNKTEILTKYRGKLSGTNKDLIERRIKYMIDLNEGGVNKYKTPYSLEKSNRTLLEPEEYFYQMRYIALCLSGQLDPKIDESYCKEVYDGTEIDWGKFFTTLPTTKEKIRKRLISCLKNIFGDSKGLK